MGPGIPEPRRGFLIAVVFPIAPTRGRDRSHGWPTQDQCCSFRAGCRARADRRGTLPFHQRRDPMPARARTGKERGEAKIVSFAILTEDTPKAFASSQRKQRSHEAY